MSTSPTSPAETTDVVTVTDAAAKKIQELLASEESTQQALRVAVSGGGCSGFQYALGFDDDVQEDDIVIESNGVRVVVDETSAEYLAGSQVDYHDGLNGRGFAVENPNSTGSCGCGQSFSC